MEHPDTVTLITGLIDSKEHVIKLIECYKNIKNKIFSTWKNTASELIQQIQDAGFIIILNDLPDILDHKNTNILNKTIYNGLLHADTLGYKFACRMRTDVFPDNHLLFLNVIRDLYQDKITVICGCDLGIGQYYLDIQIAGSLPNMIKMHNTIRMLNDKRATEIYMLEEYTNKKNLSRADIKLYMNFCLDRCITNNIEMIWFRPEHKEGVIYPRTIPYTKIIAEYCKAYFIWT